MFRKFLRIATGLVFMYSCIDKSNQHLPTLMDKNITLELVLEAPNIVTPIGLTIDDDDNIYVLESHTHFPTNDYTGLPFDRIKKGIDENGDGRPDRWLVYADSINDGMNIDWYEGNIYLVEKDSVFVIKDTDRDGIADQKDLLVQMKTVQDVYDHAGLLGITVSKDGWVYVSRGNCSGMELQLVGADGTIIDSYGEGGSVFRFRTDGSNLEEIATGFWNPFDIKFTKNGRLMVVDNDPDSRGPNRLLEIVPGGDYGYQSMYGGSGLHPFLAWNGELPGTLPMVAGIGEAPSGLIDASYSNFPEEYRGNILATIWEENSIVRVPLESSYSSVSGIPETIVQGDSSFHPVAMAANSRGDVYITDWVKRQYPNHGYGRLLLLTSRPAKPISQEDPDVANPFFKRWDNPPEASVLISDLESSDPFLQTLARALLVKGGYKDEIYALVDNEDALLRMQGLLCLKHSNLKPDKKVLADLLHDEEISIRQMTLIYIASQLRADLYEIVLDALSSGYITSEVFEIYLETLKYLQPDFIEKFQSRSVPVPKQIKTHLPDNYIGSLIHDESLSDDIRAIALPYLTGVENHTPYLISQLSGSEPKLQKALLLSLKGVNKPEAAQKFMDLATNDKLDPEVRAQSILNLEYQGSGYCEEISKLLMESNQVVVEAATRYLCRCKGNNEVEKSISTMSNSNAQVIWKRCNGTTEENRPDNNQQWLSVIDGNGDTANGWMIFQSPKAQCISCHEINKWGGIFGPALTHIGSSKSLDQLTYAILQPDKEIAPAWQGWYIKDKEGVTHYGRQIDVGGGRSAKMMLADGEFKNFNDIQDFGVTPNSLMPDGLEAQLTVSELNDLVSFLKSLK